MNIVTKSVAVVLTAAALGGLGAGVASASTPADGPAPAVAQSVAGQNLGDTLADYQVVNGTTHYDLQIIGFDDPQNQDHTWATAPTYTTIQPRSFSQSYDLDTTGKTAEQAVIHFQLMDFNTGTHGDFDATLAWFDDGSYFGQRVIKISPSTLPGATPVPSDVKLNVVKNDLAVDDAS